METDKRIRYLLFTASPFASAGVVIGFLGSMNTQMSHKK